MLLTRRQYLPLLAFALTRPALAAASVLTALEVPVPDPGQFGKQCLVLRPSRVPADVALPLLILFHGLAETEREGIGIRAWRDRYGLADAYARLIAPPVARTLPNRRYLSDARLLAINAELARTPLPDIAFVCPFTPNPFKRGTNGALLDRYADYLEHALLPAVRAATPILPGLEHTGLDGVSLGGYVSLEVFLRKPQLFGVVGTLQGAFGKPLAEVYAQRIAKIVADFGPRRVRVATTTLDPFREPAQLLARRLLERGVAATLSFNEGPHDQAFLREAGTLEMLLFQARALHADRCNAGLESH